MNRQQDNRHAIVIGAGIVGLCNAAYLQRDGWKVTLIDPLPPGEGCSFGNCGMRSDGAALPIATPGILKHVPNMIMDPMGPLTWRWSYLPQLAPWLIRFLASSRPERVDQFVRDFGALIAGARRAYEPIVAEAGLQNMIRPNGAIEVFETKEAFERARWGIEVRKKHGVPLEILGAAEVRQMEPAIRYPVAAATFRNDMDNVTSPLRYSQGIAEMIRKRGGTFVRGEARHIERGPKPSVVTDSGRMDTDLIVICAGAWSKRFSKQAGASIPLDTERGYHAMLPRPGVEMRIPVKSAEGGFYFTPMEAGLRVAGTDELAGLKAPPNWKRIEPMLKRAKRLVPDLNTEGAENWMGFRPSIPDSKPVISPAPGSRNIYFAFGHGHFGLTLAAVTAKAVADMVAGRPTEFDITPFRADRF